MIPTLAELERTLGVNVAFVPLVFAVLLTGMVLILPSIFQWFEDRKP